MTPRGRVLLGAITVAAVVIAGSLAWIFTRATDPEQPAPAAATDPGVDGDTTPDDPDATPEELGEAFFADWVDDGRVIRRDQGDDTVSEGQAYGLMIALGQGDEDRFDEVWSWTVDNLQRDDGLIAWQWSDGAIVDDEPASDADLDIARALVLAGAEFDRPDLTEDGSALATGVLDDMTAMTDVGRIIVPGTWAADTAPYPYNPSYASPGAFAVLYEHTGDERWNELQTGSRAVSTALLDESPLPPDWASVNADGTVNAMAGPTGTADDVRYSYDAARFALRHAESCDPADLALAARLLEPLSREGDGEVRSELDLGGSALSEAVHPLAYSARAAAFAAVGDDDAARRDLASGARVLDESPTYYGAAWAALAPLFLNSDTLGACPPLSEIGS